MDSFTQHSTPGVVGISTYVDAAYHQYMQTAALELAGLEGPVNRLRTVTVTLDFHRLIAHLQAGQIAAAEEQVSDVAAALAAGGADFMVVTSGTTSTLTAAAKRRVDLPILDMAPVCLDAATRAGSSKVGLLSTRQTVKGGLFHVAAGEAGCELISPIAAVAEAVDEAIFSELVFGGASEASIEVFSDAMKGLVGQGAEAIILGNTDLTLILASLEAAVSVPVIDATQVHARAAAWRALTPADRG